MSAPPPEVIEALHSARRPVMIGHINPDMDALGSMLALVRALPSPESAIALAGPLTARKARLMFQMAGGARVADAGQVADADIVVVVDTAGVNRVGVEGKWEAIADKRVVNIDHHITNTDFGQLNWVVPNASSTSEMVYRLIEAGGWPLDGATASLLYAGIFADTGGFTLPNATPESLEAAAALVRRGADVATIGQRLVRSQERHEFDLIRTVYHNTHLAADGRIAYSTLTHSEIIAAGCTPEDIDDQVSIPRSLSGVKIAMLLSEAQSGIIRINLRGEDGTPVVGIAEKLGGGGHTYSAGVRIRGTMEDALARVLEEATRQLG